MGHLVLLSLVSLLVDNRGTREFGLFKCAVTIRHPKMSFLRNVILGSGLSFLRRKSFAE